MSKKIIFNTQKTKNFIFLKNGLSKTPFVFLHGFTGTHNSWKEVLERLERPAITLDLPGHGKSTFKDLDARYSIDDWCVEFDELLNYLNVDRINKLGWEHRIELKDGLQRTYENFLNEIKRGEIRI